MVSKIQGLRVFGSMIEDDATQQEFDKSIMDLLSMLDGKLPEDKAHAGGADGSA